MYFGASEYPCETAPLAETTIPVSSSLSAIRSATHAPGNAHHDNGLGAEAKDMSEGATNGAFAHESDKVQFGGRQLSGSPVKFVPVPTNRTMEFAVQPGTYDTRMVWFSAGYIWESTGQSSSRFVASPPSS